MVFRDVDGANAFFDGDNGCTSSATVDNDVPAVARSDT